jgi:hypothetical protein
MPDRDGLSIDENFLDQQSQDPLTFRDLVGSKISSNQRNVPLEYELNS